MTTVAVFGLGEAGRLYAQGLQRAGATVRGYDPFITLGDGELTQLDDIPAVVDGADVIISLVGANASAQVADSVIPHLSETTVFADFNTSSPDLKAALAARAAAAGILFADVAVLAPVPRAGSATPLMASGAGAARTAELLGPLGAPIEVIDGEAGDAASRKLLRSVFMKGLAGVVLEAVAAGEAAHNEDWIRAQMAAELGPDGEALVDRLLTGSHAHAERRTHEMEDAVSYIGHLGTPSWMSRGALQWLSSLSPSKLSPSKETRA